MIPIVAPVHPVRPGRRAMVNLVRFVWQDFIVALGFLHAPRAPVAHLVIHKRQNAQRAHRGHLA